MCSLVLLLTISIQFLTYAVIQKPCQGNFGKLQESGESRFGSSVKDRYFLKIPKVSYFVNNAALTCLYVLNISDNIETEHVFQSKIFFHLSSNLHASCFSAFKCKMFHTCTNSFPC